MGLDITAYRKLAPIDADAIARDEFGDPKDWEAYFQPRASSDFPGRDAGLVDGAWYSVCGDPLQFRAGSYSGYNEWRELLAKLAGYPADRSQDARHQHSGGAWAAESGPFWELIHFTDCDGVIGPAVAAKLAKDFAEHDDRAKAVAEAVGESWFYDLYAKWRLAFEMAADGGAVDFH